MIKSKSFPLFSQVNVSKDFHKDSIKNPPYADGMPLPTRFHVEPTHRMATPNGRITELHIGDKSVVDILVAGGWTVVEVLS